MVLIFVNICSKDYVSRDCFYKRSVTVSLLALLPEYVILHCILLLIFVIYKIVKLALLKWIVIEDKIVNSGFGN